MKEKEIIMLAVTAKTISLETFDALVKQNKFHPVDMVSSPDHYFRVQVILQVITVNHRRNKQPEEYKQ